jgi:hypothetical protein
MVDTSRDVDHGIARAKYLTFAGIGAQAVFAVGFKIEKNF